MAVTKHGEASLSTRTTEYQIYTAAHIGKRQSAIAAVERDRHLGQFAVLEGFAADVVLKIIEEGIERQLRRRIWRICCLYLRF